MSETVYGVVSGAISHPDGTGLSILALKEAGAEKIIVMGDTTKPYFTRGEHGPKEDYKTTQNEALRLFQTVVRCGIETYFMPGGYERLDSFGQLLRAQSGRYPDLIKSVFNDPEIIGDGHHIVFLPGSDAGLGGEYHLHQGFRSTGLCVKEFGDKEWENVKEIDLRLEMLIEHGFAKKAYSTNVDSLVDLIAMPERTILISSVPPIFSKQKEAVDSVYLATKDGREYDGRAIEDAKMATSSLINRELARKLAEEEGYEFTSGNRGNVALRQLIEREGKKIPFVISSRFPHRRAHNRKVQPVVENDLAPEMFLSPGHADDGWCALLRVNNGINGVHVAYKSVDLVPWMRGFGRTEEGILVPDYMASEAKSGKKSRLLSL